MKNTGTTVWTAANAYLLGSQSPQDNLNWGTGRVSLGASESIAPGQSKTFFFTIKAPSTPGYYKFQWRMLRENVEWFGSYTPVVTINVVGKKANLEGCSSNDECLSGSCSYGTCCSVGQCGWGAEKGHGLLCFDNGGTNSNQYASGVCRNGVWKVPRNGWGCAGMGWACDSGSCVENTCVSIPANQYQTCGGTRTTIGSPVTFSGIKFTTVSNTVGAGTENKLIMVVTNTNSETKTVTYSKSYCRCRANEGNPYPSKYGAGLNVCWYYETPGQTPTGCLGSIGDDHDRSG